MQKLPELVTVLEAAAILHCKKSKVYDMIYDRTLGHFRVGKRTVLLDKEEVLAVLRRGYTPAKEDIA